MSTLAVDSITDAVGSGAPAFPNGVSGNIVSTGALTATGIYLGGTGSANLLDDYEEGTWVAAANNYTGSFANVRGTYVKIGKKVFIDLFLQTSDDSSTTATFSISGLPFTSDSTTNSYSTFATMSYNNPNGTAIAGCQISPGSSSIRMLKKTSATNPAWADWQGQDVNGGGEISLSFSYSVY